MLGDWRAAAWPECGHLARLGWKSQTGRPERKRFAFHTMGMRAPEQVRWQASTCLSMWVPIRLMFNAKHTRSHSPRTFAKPRRLNRRNPSTSLIHPFGASERLALRVPGFARGARQFLTHAVRGREPGRVDRHLGLAFTPQRYRVDAASSNRSGSLQ